MEIIIEPLVTEKQTALFDALIEKSYFGTEKSARRTYLKGIQDFILSLPYHTARKTKDDLYGHYFASFKANRHTTWYILFDIKDDHYLVKNIINNHSEEYPSFISRLR